jgi:hypothetical protein
MNVFNLRVVQLVNQNTLENEYREQAEKLRSERKVLIILKDIS